MSIASNEITAFIGPSGCGKSTFLKSLNRMNDLVEGCKITGSVLLDGEDIYNGMDVNLLRKRVGMVFQKPNPFPMSIYDNIAYGPRTHGIRSKAKLDEIVEKSLRDAAIWDEVKDRLKKSALGMSGGQQQRIGILRALAASPPIVLMDEPFSALDPMTRRTLQQEVRSLQQKLNKTFVFVTHDMEEALDLADVIIFMDHGRIVQMAPPEEMLAHPASGLIQDFLGKFINTPSHKALTAADFMRTGVYTVSTRKGINECISKMQRHNVDTLIVVDDAGRYAGTVSIADIRLNGHVVTDIAPLVRTATPTVHSGDDAKGCFEQLISSGASYLVVLGEAEQVEGIITKTSMASAMAEQLWG